VFFRDYPDGTLENTLDVKREVVKVIRQIKAGRRDHPGPSVLYSAQHGFVNHPDHRAAGQAALDRRVPFGPRPHEFSGIACGRLRAAQHQDAAVIQFRPQTRSGRRMRWTPRTPLELKFQALAAHASQFSDLENMKTSLRELAAETGHLYEYAYAEPFVRIDIT